MHSSIKSKELKVKLISYNSTTLLANGKHLRFDIFELQETKFPVLLINTTNEWRLVQGHETPPRMKGDIEDVSSELDNGRPVFNTLETCLVHL
ncbi:UNVERIFIED_CONTAM: hypothetical protein NCL1_47634 [Trichonephila clavipes]